MDNSSKRENEEQQTERLAYRIGARYSDSRSLPEPAVNEDLLTYLEIKSHKVLPLGRTNFGVSIAFTERTPQTFLREIKQRFSTENLDLRMISQSGFDEFFENFKNVYEPEIDPLKNLNQSLMKVPGKKRLTFLVTKAFRAHASDIHIEPEDDFARIRFRIDGRLQPVDKVNELAYRGLLGDIKIQGETNVMSEYGQTGHINTEVEDENGKLQTLNIRVEIIPAVGGSDIVMRLFTIEEEFLNLENLGMLPYQQKVVDEIIKQPHGLLLSVGPTGSGKTSTLYSILNQLRSDNNKIVTLEDPVEYELRGVTQIPVDSSRGDSFAGRLRSVVREDPDIIMVGEIRDPDTAVTALQASLTGHFVASTFHANSAAAAVSRLTDMIGRNTMLASSIRLVMAQRLVRRVCEVCRQPRKPNETELKEVFTFMQTVPDSIKAKAMQQPLLFTAHGCDACSGIGYKGRIVVAEQMQVTDLLADFMVKQAGSALDIENFAIQQGMVTILQDGILKALLGHTTLDEVFRVLGKPVN